VTATTEALTITAVGMGLVFLALGIVLLTMILLQKIFSRPAKAAPAALPAEETPPAHPAVPPMAAMSEEVAAIAVALARAMAEETAGPAPAGLSAWAGAGRYRQLNQPLMREKKR
jgi:sodium pump decarboxylase gamma subunit